ncbi:phenylacetic acid degradation bifunctional protein PaaZ [Mesorhizobium sp. NBSH29]|uniref:phenylacetic acid degradation bifunctional protein PaaZ n=1 Tax=Mesorhizobium sp. NBSH29 TaxID=2654249 RepID=UPI0018969CF8|nr:phenylacetic acid degradation bifunctional protein PaaZ [Mesorhizobium sp. NBSH29]QPC88255.1 phenylacetic acid degradation bifunctional protein PaaZ [Mesorhizobium sp. NBSH29]
MSLITLDSFAAGKWVAPAGTISELKSAVTGEAIARIGSSGLDFSAMSDHARNVGGSALRALTFHDRARILKALATYLNERREPLYELSYDTGTTKSDAMIDIDGGIATLFVYASKGRRELPDDVLLTEGALEQLSRSGSFVGQHVATSLRGVAIHINAFNFPVWGMLEKLAPAFLAGVPAIIKPASSTAWVAQACFRMIVESGLLPQGSVQFIAGPTGDLLERLTAQDIVSFTGSATTAAMLRANPRIAENSVRFIAEQDSLNATILGPDAAPDTPEFDIFLREVHREITAKAGQKCTAIRRIIVPDAHKQAVIDALIARLEKTTIGDPRNEATRMGALASQAQRRDVLEKAEIIGRQARRVFGDPQNFALNNADATLGAFVPPMLFDCAEPDGADDVHSVEAFGPVSTVMGYRDLDHALALANRGEGSLVASIFTHDPKVARQAVLEAGAWHGRLYFANRDTGKEATGHGSPLPHMIHGGPGRAGGGEEMGGIRGVLHYMQRTAIQGSPDIIAGVTGRYVAGAKTSTEARHPFRLSFSELEIGHTLKTASRQITLEDIAHFANFTGDTFYAHMDEEAARANPFFPGRVAHGYLLIAFAAGLFVDPAPGPVLANSGLDGLRFMKPVSPGDSICVELTAMAKTPRNEDYGEVRWQVRIDNQDGEQVAGYELLTMNAL